MAGHSKWSKIKRKKAVADQKKGKVFTRCIHEITVAVREGGGGDPGHNARLALAIDNAKAVNMPNDNIDRAIKRATGEIKSDEQYELTYEGYGPGGVAVMVDVLTNNKNRTVSEVRHAFSKSGGTLGENGSVGFLFEKKGVLSVKKELIGEEELMEAALEAGAEDINDEEDVWEIITEPTQFHAVQENIKKHVELDTAELMMIPKNKVEVSGKDAEQIIRLIENLDDLDDVLNVWANCEVPDELEEGAA